MKPVDSCRSRAVQSARPARRRMAACGLAMLGPLIAALAAAPERAPIMASLSAREIMSRAIARAEAQYESQVESMFEAEAVSTIHSLDAEDRITKTEETRYRLYPVHGAVFEEMREKNGQPLSEKDRKKEEEKKRQFIREVEARKARGEHPQPERPPGIRFNHEFVDRYQLEMAGTETVRGYRCWVIAFKPKEGKLPVKNRMDRALNQSTGRFWISQEDCGLARIEFALREPFKYWGGFLAVIRNTDGGMDYERVEANIWLPSHFSLKLDLEVMMIKDIRRHIEKDWRDYKRVGRDIAADELAGKENYIETSASGELR